MSGIDAEVVASKVKVVKYGATSSSPTTQSRLPTVHIERSGLASL